jgi:predicted extracellular nuclease
VFIPLVDLDAGTQIIFTDSGLLSDGTSFRGNEGAVRYDAPQPISAGTAILYNGVGGSFSTANDSNVGLNGFSLSTSGDQVIAFQGASNAPEFIFAVQTNSTQWQTEATNTNTSALPAGLSDGATAAAVGAGTGAGDEHDNAEYNRAVTSGDAATLRAAVADNNNWNGNNSPIALNTDGFSLDGGGTTGPALADSSPANGSAEVAVGLGSMALTFDEGLIEAQSDPSQWTVTCDGGDVLDGTPAVDFGAGTATLPLTTLPDSASCVVTVPAGSVTGADSGESNSVDLAVRFTTETLFAGCGDDGATPIHQVQGSGSVSPLEGTRVSIEGVVVGDFQATDGTGLRGFFVQEEDDQADLDPASSEGIFVYDSGFGVDVALGDIVRVSGTVVEYPSSAKPDALTEIGSVTDVQLCSGLTGTATPALVELPLTTDPATELEPVEGMAVDIVEALDADPADDALTLAEYFNLDRYGEIRVAAGGRPRQFTHSNSPDVAGYAAHLTDMARRTLLIDDGRSGQNLEPLFFGRGGNPLSVTPGFENLLRGGDTVGLIEGVMHFDFGVYRVEPVVSPDFVAGNERPADPPAVAGRIKVASFNVLNYFQQLDDGTAKCGPPGNLQECRGADAFTEENVTPRIALLDTMGRNERDRQEAKLIPALLELDADVYGLIELENDFGGTGTTSAANLARLMNSANGTTVTPANGCASYAAVAPGAYVGTDVIGVGIIYCEETVAQAPGTTIEILDDSDLDALGLDGLAPLFNGENTNRASLAATFEETATGERFTVAVNHFKSKGGAPSADCATDPGTDLNCDQNDGAGAWNQRRTDAATALRAWLATDPTGANDPDLLLVGDLNAYAKEDPIAALEAAGYENLIASRIGAGAYSYLFDAQLGGLDYALASATLATQVTGVGAWHINADEPDALDYDISFNPEEWFAEDEYRTSDHDPVVVGLDLMTQAAVPGDLDGDGQVTFNPDRGLFLAAYGSTSGGAGYRADADFDGDGVIGLADYRAWYAAWVGAGRAITPLLP